jgi:hypothetical protein
MRRSRSFLIASCVSVLPVCFVKTAKADEICPTYPLGVTERQTNNGETFYASAFVRPFRDDEESLIESRREAQIAARLLLQRDKRVPLGANGRLQGVKDEGTCVAGGRVYFSVSFNLKSAAQAIELSERLRKSLAAKPTPQLRSFSWTDDGKQDTETEELRRLIGP